MEKNLFTFLLALVATLAQAGTIFQVDGLLYETLNTSAKTVALIGYYDKGNTATTLTVPGIVTYNNQKWQVTVIDRNAFANNTYLEKVNIHYGVKELRNSAFNGCTSLKTVQVRSSANAIGDLAFANCSSLTNVALAGNVKTISSTAFANSKKGYLYCATYRDRNSYKSRQSLASAFSSITVNPSWACDWIYYARVSAYSNCPVYIVVSKATDMTSSNPDPGECRIVGGAGPGVPLAGRSTSQGVSYIIKEVADSAFLNNTKITTVSGAWTDKARTIGIAAFAGCTALQYAYPVVDSIMARAFLNCTKLATLQLVGGNGPYYIGTQAFAGCASLTSVTLNGTLKTLGLFAFDGCTNLKEYKVTGSTVFSADNGRLFNYAKTALVHCPPACQDFTLPSTVSHFRAGAFAGNPYLKTITLPYGLTVVSSFCFEKCTNLESIFLPSTVKQILAKAFKGCTGLKLVSCNSSTPPSALSTTFSDCNEACVLQVPMANNVRNLYKAAQGWNVFKSKMSAYSSYDFIDSETPSPSFNYNRAFTITSTKGVTWNGTTYAGTVKIVKNRLNNLKDNRFINDYATYHGKKYLVNEIDDYAFTSTQGGSFTINCNAVTKINPYAFSGQTLLTSVDLPEVTLVDTAAFAGCTSLSKIGKAQKLATIGQRAFNGTAVRKFVVPATVTKIGAFAFTNCKQLTRLELQQQDNALRSWDGQFYGGNAATFKCYVPHDEYYNYQKSIANWTKYSIDPNMPTENLNCHFTPTSETMVFSTNYPVDFRGSNIEAYTLANYVPSKQMVHAQQCYQAPAATGVILSGLTQGKTYYLDRPHNTPINVSNLLVATATAAANVYNQSMGFYYNDATKSFVRPTASRSVGMGRAYLKLPAAVAGTTKTIYIDIFGSQGKGDIDGNGTINVSDVTALINKLLGTASYSDTVCDIDGNGIVNVSDVTALIGTITH